MATKARQQPPQHHEFAFFGPHGPLGIMIGLPLVCYALYFVCHTEGCLDWTFSFPSFPSGPLISVPAVLFFWGWMLLVLTLHLVLPGTHLQGTTLKDGTKLNYKLNATTCFSVLIAGTIIPSFGLRILDIGWLYDNYLPLIGASIFTSTLLSFYLYLSSFQKGKLLGEEGNTGYPIYDFWMGRELNPRIGSIDLKEWCELYPGLTLWVVLNISMAYKQYTDIGYLTNGMILVNLFQFIYVLDAHVSEKSILTTMDITTEGFGFMLAFGDLTWVPFIYSLQTRYMVDNPTDLSLGMVLFILLLQGGGYYIFRGANGQKDAFRRNPNDPSVKHLKTLPTERGTKLLISGWWGTARHINYTGDWMMGWAWCLPTGFSSIVPYFYVIYFGSLLVHREMRDEHACKQKYGKDWDKYCSIVKYRFVPYLY